MAVDSFAAVGRTPGSPSVSTVGSAQYSIPFTLPAGRRGLTPQLGLVYDSNGGRDVAGVGWAIYGASFISRCEKTVAQDGTAKGVRNELSDGYCLDGRRLRLASGTYGTAGSTYRTELNDFSRITAYGTAGNGPAYFKVETREGLIRWYGYTADSRVESLGQATVRAWAVNRIEDRQHNSITFSWGEDTTNGGVRLEVVRYTGSDVEEGPYTVDFQYVARADVNVGYIAGSQVREVNRLSAVEVTYLGALVRRYNLTYEISPATGRERLTGLQECAGSPLECLSPSNFTYQNGSIGVGATQTLGLPAVPQVDINGDGRDDVLYDSGGIYLVAFANAAGGFNTPVNTSVAVHPNSIYGDYNADGKADILSPINGKWWVKLGTTSGLAAPVNTNIAATTTGVGANATLIDVNADGRADLVWADLIGYAGGDTIKYRAGLAGGGFSSTVTTLLGPLVADERIIETYWGSYRKRLDFNADERDDYAVQIAQRTSSTPQLVASGAESQAQGATVTYTYSYRLNGYCPGATQCWVGAAGPTVFNKPTFGDYNGDGKTDVFYWNMDGHYHYLFSTGVGTTAEQIGSTLWSSDWIVADWDGDGFEDALMPYAASGTWYLMRSNGLSFDAPVNTGVALPAGTSTTFYAIDVNADGADDLTYGTYSGGTYHYYYWLRSPSGTSLPDRLSTAEDGYGTRATFSYRPIADSAVYTKGSGTTAPTLDVVGGRWVVSSLATTDGTGGTSEVAVDFTYSGARTDTQGRGFLGFEKRTSVDHALGYNLKTLEAYQQAYPYIGGLRSVEVQQVSGTRISYQVNNWTAPLAWGSGDTASTYPIVQSSTVEQHEVGGVNNGQKVVSVVTSIATVDPVSGLALDVTRTTTEVATGLFPGSYRTEHLQHTAVANDTANWCLGRPTTTVETHSHTLADGAAIARTTGTTWDTTACRVTQTKIEPGSATLELTTSYGFDAFGNVNAQTVSGVGVAARTTTIGWGSSGRFPESVTDALGQVTLNTFDAALAVPRTSTDPNGLSTTWNYDAFGRRTSESRPDLTSSTWTYSACTTGCDPRAKMQVLREEKDADGLLVRSQSDFLDRFDRPILQRAHLLTAGDIYWPVQREYDARGAVVKEYAPHLNGADNGYHGYTYDAVNRVLSESLVRPGGATYATTGYTYNGLQVSITDPRFNTTTRALAAWGPLLRTVDAAGGQANYQYDAFDALKQTTDPAGNLVTRLTYNLRGMRTQQADMDLGSWAFAPDALGEVLSQTDAKGQTTTFEFDLLGRLKKRTEAEGSSTWTWGTTNSASEKNIGRLVSVSGPGYTDTFAYDTLARPRQRTINADDAYLFDYTYDRAGRLQTLTYPTSTAGVRFKAKYGYSGGYLSSVQEYTGDVNGPVLWTLNLLDAGQHATSEAFGNGLWVQNSYDPLTGEPATRQSGTGGQTTSVQNLAYAWDAAGNLASRQDLRQGLLESFSYDALDRVTNVAGPQNTSIGYDAIGNLTSKSGIAGSFVYDAVRKHAVTSAGGTSYGYDANGNMTSRGGATINWSSYNLPTVINGPGGYSAQFAYAPDRSRWRQVSSYTGGSETTIYVGGLLEKLTTATRTHFKHLIATPSGQVQVIRRSDGTSETLYVTTDHLGSTDAVLNAAGAIVLRASFAVYGERRAGSWQGAPSSSEWQDIANTTRRGYTGHEMLDNVLLIHMNGRVFDPAIGRFISADPYVDGADSTQGWNRYAYVHGGPLSATDPSGFLASPCAFRACYWSSFDWPGASEWSLEDVVVTASRWTYQLRSNWEWDTIGSVRDLVGRRNELVAHLSDGPAVSASSAGKESGAAEEPALEEVVVEEKKCGMWTLLADLDNALRDVIWNSDLPIFSIGLEGAYGHDGHGTYVSASFVSSPVTGQTSFQVTVAANGPGSLDGVGPVANLGLTGSIGYNHGPTRGGVTYGRLSGFWAALGDLGLSAVFTRDTSGGTGGFSTRDSKFGRQVGLSLGTLNGQIKTISGSTPSLVLPPGKYSGC